MAIRIWLLRLPTFKPNRYSQGHSNGKSSTDQNDPNFNRHQYDLFAAPNHGTEVISQARTASVHQALIRLIDAAKSLSRTTKVGMMPLHQCSVSLLDLLQRSVGIQAQHR